MPEPAPASSPQFGASATRGIVVRGVSKRYAGQLALPPTDLVAAPGAVTLLVGANGAGKTTLLRVLATLVHPDEGSALVDGRDPVHDGRAVRERLGLALVNERAIYWRLTVLQNLELFARIRGLGRRERREHCREILEELQLGALADRRANSLSAGQRQRAILGRALTGDPEVVLVDEPLRGLDAGAEDAVLAALKRRAAMGATVLVATPSQREYGGLGDVPVWRAGERHEDLV